MLFATDGKLQSHVRLIHLMIAVHCFQYRTLSSFFRMECFCGKRLLQREVWQAFQQFLETVCQLFVLVNSDLLH